MTSCSSYMPPQAGRKRSLSATRVQQSTTITSSKIALSSALSKLLHSIVYRLHLLIYFLLCHFALSSLLQISFLLVTLCFYDPTREKYMASRLVLTASVSAPRLKCMTSLSVFTLTPFILKRFSFHSYGVFCPSDEHITRTFSACVNLDN